MTAFRITRRQLFKEYFGSSEFRASDEGMDRELATFFHLMFGIDVDNTPVDSIIFPTFEEVLGLTDLAILRKEAFKNFDIENRAISQRSIVEPKLKSTNIVAN